MSIERTGCRRWKAWGYFVVYNVFCFCCAITTAHSKTIEKNAFTFVAPHFPPFQIHQKSGIIGIDIEIAKHIGSELNIEFEFQKCPLKRCLIMLEEGQADMTSSLMKQEGRAKYLHFVEPSYLTDNHIVFHVQTGHKSTLARYQDLYRFERIAIVKGAKHFDRFDNDHRLKLLNFPLRESLYQMLAAGRLEVVVGYDLVSDYIINKHQLRQKIEKSDFHYLNENPVHFSVSKHSELAKKIPEISAVISNLIQNDTITQLVSRHSVESEAPHLNYRTLRKNRSKFSSR